MLVHLYILTETVSENSKHGNETYKKLNPDEIRKQAEHSESGKNRPIVLNGRAGKGAGKEYYLFCSAYTENEDIVINLVERSDMVRFGRKRTWSLWCLCCGIMVLLGYSLWKTRLYIQGADPSREQRIASKKGAQSCISLLS